MNTPTSWVSKFLGSHDTPTVCSINILAQLQSLSYIYQTARYYNLAGVMGTLVYLICIAVASFAVLAQPAVAQGTNTTLPLTYPGQVLQGDGSQTCPSEAQWGITRNEVKNATQRLLWESVVPLLQNSSEHPCGGSTGWRHVAYLNMSDPSQQCPSVWGEIPHSGCVGEDLPLVAVRGSLTPLHW